jgi:hypothetical protein
MEPGAEAENAGGEEMSGNGNRKAVAKDEDEEANREGVDRLQRYAKITDLLVEGKKGAELEPAFANWEREAKATKHHEKHGVVPSANLVPSPHTSHIDPTAGCLTPYTPSEGTFPPASMSESTIVPLTTTATILTVDVSLPHPRTLTCTTSLFHTCLISTYILTHRHGIIHCGR